MFTRSNKHSLSKALPWFAPCTLEPWSWLISDSEHMMFSYTREDPKPPGHHSRARMEPRRSTIPVTNKAGANGSCCVHVVSMFTNAAPITNRSFAPWGWKDTCWWCDNQGSASDGLGFFSWYFGFSCRSYRNVEYNCQGPGFSWSPTCGPGLFCGSQHTALQSLRLTISSI